MNVQSFCLFTLPNDIIDFTFYNLVVGFAADFFQFQTSAMITRHDFIVNKPPEIIKEKKKIYFIRSPTKVMANNVQFDTFLENKGLYIALI